MNTSQRIEAGLKPTLESIEGDLIRGDLDCLFFATEKQISSLIDKGAISEDYSSLYQDYQEEMRILEQEF